MPRRPPAAVRAALPLRRPQFSPAIPRLTSLTMNAIRHLERDRLYPGAVAQALRQWRLGVGNPSYLLNPHPCCDPGLGRGDLEIALHALPKHAARELRALLLPLDDRYLARIPPNPTMPPTAPWWERHQWAVR